MRAKSLQLCPTLCDPMDCSPLGSSVHRIFQARMLEWVAISSSRGPSLPRDRTCVSYVSCICRSLMIFEKDFFIFNSSVARTCNLILIVLDVLKPLGHKKIIENELEGFGIRLNSKPPNIGFKKKDKGGINLTATVSEESIWGRLLKGLGWRVDCGTWTLTFGICLASPRANWSNTMTL